MPIFKPITPVLDLNNSIASGLFFDDPMYLNDGGLVSKDLVNNNSGSFLGTTKPSWIQDTSLGLGVGISLDGITSRIDYPNIAAYNITPSALTLETWCIFTSFNSTANIMFGKPVADGSHSSPFFDFSNQVITGAPNYYRCFLTTSGNSGGQANGSGGANNLSTGILYQLLATYDGSNIKTYINGVAGQTAACTGTLRSDSTLIRAGANGLPGEFFPGKLFINRGWNRALSTTEIELLYENPFRIYLPLQTNNHQFVKVGNGMSAGERIR